MDWLTPADADELAGALAARAPGSPPLLPTGAAGPPEALDAPRSTADDADVLSTASLAGLEELRPRDLTVSAGAGTRVVDLLTKLAGEGVWVPLGGPAAGMSVGGLAAAAPAGPFDESFGDLKRQLLACGLVTPDGERLRWGRAVMKDVAGYSMVRSVTGGFGRTGVLHRATFRLWPAPVALATPTLVPEEGAPDPLELAGTLATSDADASVRPDAAVWSWTPEGPDDGSLEVRLVGTEASVGLRLEKLRDWARGRGTELDGDDVAAFDPLAAAGFPGGDGPAPGLPAAGPGRDPEVSAVAVRTGRADFAGAAHRVRRALAGRAVALEGYPMAGHLRCAYRRDAAAAREDGPGDGADDRRPPGPFARLQEAAGDAPVRVERGSAGELEAADARRSEGARRLEARVLEELGGRPRHWLAAYL